MLAYLPAFALVIAAPISFGACTFSRWDGPSVAGSGNIVEEARPVADFDEIEIGGAFEVLVTVGPAPSLHISGDDNLLPYVRTEVRGSKLIVESDEDLDATRDIQIRVTTPALAAVSSGGSSEVRVTGVRATAFRASVAGSSELAAEGEFGDLDASVSGSGEIDLAGTADRAELSVSGSGEIDMAEVQARTAEVDVSGSGQVDVHATEALDASISGSGDVRYIGDPAVTQSISGSGSVRRG